MMCREMVPPPELQECLLFPTARPSSTGESWSCTSCTSRFGQRSPDPPDLCDGRRRGAKRAESLLERNRSAVGKTKAPLVAGGPQQLTPAAPYSPPLELNRSTVVTSQLFGESASALLCSRLASPVACPNHPSCPGIQ